MAGTQEAGFLTSFCPISTFPAVVVIKCVFRPVLVVFIANNSSCRNGTLQDYLQATTSKDQFKQRLITAVEGSSASVSVPTQQPQSAAGNDSTISSSSLATPPVLSDTASQQQSPSPHASMASPRPKHQTSQETAKTKQSIAKKDPVKKAVPPKSQTSKAEPDVQSTRTSGQKSKSTLIPPPTTSASKKATTGPSEESKSQSPAPRGPPSQYRLQVRLFDGRSIRSSFTPTQTIRGDVRPWLDQQMGDDHRPYNLKHILTPLPSRTLSVTEESQTLQDLSLGSTANLVMVPVQSYTEAYSAAGSLPVRAVSGAYNVVSSVAGTATGLVGSFLGYGSSASTNESASSPSSAEDTRRTRRSGPNIRTLRDQQNERGDSQLYNGNQVCYRPTRSPS